MSFSAPGVDFTEVNELLQGYLDAHDQWIGRDVGRSCPSSRFEANIWGYLTRSVGLCYLRLEEVSEIANNESFCADKHYVPKQLKLQLALLREACPIAIHLGSFTREMDHMQKAVYVYNLLEDSASDLLHQFMSGEATRFVRLEKRFRKIVTAFESDTDSSFSMQFFNDCGEDIEGFVFSAEQSEEIISTLSGLAHHYDPMPGPLFSERTFYV